MLDWITDSFDLWEEVDFLSKDKQEYFKNTLSKEFIQDILDKNFKWEIEQVPPKYSALKINWERAYNLARAWESFEMKKKNYYL